MLKVSSKPSGPDVTPLFEIVSAGPAGDFQGSSAEGADPEEADPGPTG